jgi:hypothetical protein
MAERIEQRPRLRDERVPDEAVIIVRGGPNSVARLTQHAMRTAEFWNLDGEPLYGVSVFCALDDVGPASLPGVLAQLGSYPTVHLTTAGRLAAAGFELLATASRPHFTVRTAGAGPEEIERLLVALGEPRDNDYRTRPRRRGR